MLVALTSAIAVGVAIWIGREKNRVDKIALGMVLGGALGNILDRTLSRLCRRLRSTSILASAGRFWYSMSAMRRLASPS